MKRNEINPDIIQFHQVKRVIKKIKKDRKEIKYESGDGYKSYNPPQYKYSYEFKFTIELIHPYIDRLSISLLEKPMIIENPYFNGSRPGLFAPKHPTFQPDEMKQYDFIKYHKQLEEMEKCMNQLKNSSFKPPKIPKTNTFQPRFCPWCGTVSNQSIYENCKCCGGPLLSK